MKPKLFIILLLALLFSSPAWAVDINIDERDTVDARWSHPTEYIDGSELPPENIISTILERNCSGAGWVILPDIPAPASTYSDPTAPLGVGVCLYRAKTVAIGAVIGSQAGSDYSNTLEANLYRPKYPAAPVLTLE